MLSFWLGSVLITGESGPRSISPIRTVWILLMSDSIKVLVSSCFTFRFCCRRHRPPHQTPSPRRFSKEWRNCFTSSRFEFGAQATAVAITAGASATASTTGTSAGASGGKNDATAVGNYYRGMAVFTVAKGGLMYEASVGGQKFKYKAK